MIPSVFKQQRLRKGLSVRQLALLAGVSRSRISDFERGKSDMGSKQMLKLMLLLGFEVTTPDEAIILEHQKIRLIPRPDAVDRRLITYMDRLSQPAVEKLSQNI